MRFSISKFRSTTYLSLINPTMKLAVLGALFILVSLSAPAKAQDNFKADTKITFLQEKSTWTDSIVQTLSREEKIAQLIMIPVYSNKDRVHEDSISRLVQEYKVGGLIYFQGGPVRQARMTNRFQRESK